HPKLVRASVEPPSILQPSVPSAPARKIANSRRTIPAISRFSAELRRDSALAVGSESSDLSLLVDGDNRVRIHCSTGDEVFAEACFGERLPVGRVPEDFFDVVAIPAIYELARARRVVEYHRRSAALRYRPGVPPGACRILETKMSLMPRTYNRNISVGPRRGS